MQILEYKAMPSKSHFLIFEAYELYQDLQKISIRSIPYLGGLVSSLCARYRTEIAGCWVQTLLTHAGPIDHVLFRNVEVACKAVRKIRIAIETPRRTVGAFLSCRTRYFVHDLWSLLSRPSSASHMPWFERSNNQSSRILQRMWNCFDY